MSQKRLRFNPPYDWIALSGGVENGSSSHLKRSILVNVLSRRETTRFAKSHLYFAIRLSQHKSSMVVKAVHICVSTALGDVPMKLLMRSSSLRFRKKISISHRALYSAAMVDAAKEKLLERSSTAYWCSSFHTAMRRSFLGYFALAEGSSNCQAASPAF